MTQETSNVHAVRDAPEARFGIHSVGLMIDDLITGLRFYQKGIGQLIQEWADSPPDLETAKAAAVLADRLAAVLEKLRGAFPHADPDIALILRLAIPLEAIKSRKPLLALDHIVCDDPGLLMQRLFATRMLHRWDRTGCSLGELAEQIQFFIRHLEMNRASVIRTGMSPAPSGFPLWLAAWLGNLYPMLTTDVGCPPQRRGAVTGPGLRCFVYDVLERVHGLRGCCMAEYTGCDCPHVPLHGVLTAEDRQRIAAWRERLLSLKLKVLSHVHEALVRRDVKSLWPRCLAVLTEGLLADDAEFFLRVDQAFLGYDIRNMALTSAAPEQMPGGLTALFQLIGHCEVEICIGLDVTLGNALRGIAEFGRRGMDGQQAESLSYFDFLGSPAESTLITALERMRELARPCLSFWLAFQKRVNDALESEFYEELVIRHKVRRKFRHRFEPEVSAYANLLSVRLETGGPLPQPRVDDTGPDPRPNRYTFRRRGDYWEVGDDQAPPRLVQDSKGMQYIALLLQRPGKASSALDLTSFVEQPQAARSFDHWQKEKYLDDEEPSYQPGGETGSTYTSQDLADIRERVLPHLKEHLADAQSQGLESLVAESERGIEEFNRILAQAGHKGRRRRGDGTARERARKAVSKCIRDALNRIKRIHPEVWRHIKLFLTPGQACVYDPSPTPDWQF